MKYDPGKHHRRSIRLKGYDYSQAGAYFVTICTQERDCLFGNVEDGEIWLNEHGQIVQAIWDDLPHHYAGVVLDAFVVMPNHVHAIVVITHNVDVGAGLKPAPTKSGLAKPAPTIPAPAETKPKHHGLPEIIRGFKTFSARRINEYRNTPGSPIWQRSYFEHIIRNEESLNRIREYITNNPLRWDLDRENPAAIASASNTNHQEGNPWRD
jgi:putative transposase